MTYKPASTSFDVDGGAIREARKRAGLEIKALAEKVAISRQYLSMIETGSRTRISVSVFRAIVDALDVEPDDLLSSDPATARLAS